MLADLKYLVSGNAPYNYPVETLFGLLYTSEQQMVEVPYMYPLCGEWGQPVSRVYKNHTEKSLPQAMDLVYLSIVERRFYSLEKNINENNINQKWNIIKATLENNVLPYFVVGFAPYGLVALWINGGEKSVLVSIFRGTPVEVDMADFRTNQDTTLADVCQNYMTLLPHVKECFECEGLPPRILFDKYMQQFTYRYLQVFEKWDNEQEYWLKYEESEGCPVFDYIEETLYDGTHDKLHDGGLMKYHEAGKPKKLRVQWHIGKSEYSAYFWFEDERIREVFDRFYGAHPDTKTDFIIRIDAEKRKYELALYRYGLKEPQIIPEDVYQLLVFKNKFEDYRSENYNQERGAWIW